jgi:hypothetical protein
VFLKKRKELRQEERKRERERKSRSKKRKNSSAPPHTPIEEIEHGGLIVDVLIIQRWGVALRLLCLSVNS